MRVFFVDFENVHSEGMLGVEQLGEDDEVVIFYSANADSVSFEILHKLMFCKARLFYFKIKRGGKNALDFQLSSYLGYRVSTTPDADFYIISKDSGFEFVMDFWTSGYVETNVTIRRFINIKTVLNWDAGQEKLKTAQPAPAAADKPAEVKPAPKVEPAKVAPKVEPAKVTPKADLVEVIAKAEPAKAAPKAEPANIAPKTDLVEVIAKAQPAKAAPKAEPAKIAPATDLVEVIAKAEPAKAAPKAEPAKAAPKAEPAKTQPKADLVEVIAKAGSAKPAPKAEPAKVIAKAEPEKPAPKAEPTKPTPKPRAAKKPAEASAKPAPKAEPEKKIEITEADLAGLDEFMAQAGSTHELYINAVKKFGQKKGLEIYRTLKLKYAALKK